MRETPTRERIVTNALRLFAERGFKGTAVTEIEAAAGLAPGSGGLYSHFRTKEEVLAAAIEHSVQLAETGYSVMPLLPLGDLRAELTLIVRGSMLVMNTWRDLIRVLLREAEQFPEVMAQAREQMFERAHRWFSDWLAAKAKTGEVADADFDVVAVIFLGAANQYWIITSLVDGPPLALDEDRFVTGWVATLLAVLTPPTSRKADHR
jgi:AcrR family transcriptional regulator